MPSTTYNVTMIQSACGNYSRQQILEVLNEVSLIAYQNNTMLVEKIDTATGMPPLFTTIAGQRHYQCPVDCRETAAIFIENPMSYLPSQQRGVYGEYIWKQQRYYRVPIKQVSATRNGLATVTFVDDPGSTTDIFYHCYFVRHVPILSEFIELPFPEEVHYLIRDGVIQMLKGESYSAGMGNVGPIEQMVNRIRSKLNKGANARTYRTPIQQVDRDDNYSGYDY